MKSISVKYILLSSIALITASAFSQQTNQAMVTIVGDVPDANQGNLVNTGNEAHDFINSNPYSENNEPQIQQQLTSQNIEPTLENGFHIRFELNSSKTEEPLLASGLTASASSSSGGTASVGKTKKHSPSLAERSFNTKKRLKSWLPERKKRYHPHLCGRF
ncbi:MAG TPA: hypothetical protein VGC65_07175 [Bacteroidia bacterium]|jgi:hypothetical protein